MDNTLRDKLDRLADKAHVKADLARENATRHRDLAGGYAIAQNHAKAGLYRDSAARYLNDYFYWKGQAVALHGVAAGLGLREVVEEELDDTPSCP